MARVLVVDDDPWIQRMVGSILLKRGHVIDTAADGRQGLERAAAQKPDVIITDVMMPHMDGWAFVRAVRSRPELALTPVIFLSALTADNDRIRGFRLGADDYLPKPFRFDELAARVTRALEKRSKILAEVGAPGALPPQGGLASRAAVVAGAGPEAGAAGSAKADGSIRGAGSGAPVDTAEKSTVLHGALDHIGVATLLVILEMEQKTGTLLLQHEGALGKVLLRGGNVVRAALDPRPDSGQATRANAEAVYHLLTWGQGRFDFASGPVEGADEIGRATTFLLMEGARLVDEMTRDREPADAQAGSREGDDVVS